MEKKREKTINFDENIKKLEELVNDEAIDKAIIDAQALIDKYPVKKDTLIACGVLTNKVSLCHIVFPDTKARYQLQKFKLF